MSNINNKLIGIFAVLAFIISASPAFARGGVVQSGVIFTPYQYPATTVNTDQNSTNTTNTNQTQTTTTTNTAGTNTNSTDSANNRTTTYRTIYLSNGVDEAFRSDHIDYNRTTASTAGAATDINSEYGRLTANAVSGSNGFWPTGIFQWIVFFFILVIIITLVRYIRGSKEVYMEAPMKHA